MPLIINSTGKVKRLSTLQKYLKSVAYQQYIEQLTGRLSEALDKIKTDMASAEALDKLADIYGVRRMNAASPDGEYCGCAEESDEALRTRLKYLVRGYV